MKNKKIIITGIQNTTPPHMGNIFGMINPTININNNNTRNYLLIFIADLHALTQIHNKKLLKLNTYKIVAIFLSLGLKINKNTIIYRQSQIPEITELAWYLSCFYSYKRLKLAHAFKEKKKYMTNINIGLFSYPILMSADILLFNANSVIVGKDQLQHLEITRRIAKKFNNLKKNIFQLPAAEVNNDIINIPGIDGKKMSKSKNNIIDIFASKKKLKTQITKIKTHNIAIDSIKQTKNDTILSLYKLIVKPSELHKMEYNYQKGGYSYKNAKQELYAQILQNFTPARKKFNYLMNNKKFITNILKKGEKKIKKISAKNIAKIRKLFYI
jgi:tryptophanyl-tRNA synthetase